MASQTRTTARARTHTQLNARAEAGAQTQDQGRAVAWAQAPAPPRTPAPDPAPVNGARAASGHPRNGSVHPVERAVTGVLIAAAVAGFCWVGWMIITVLTG
ncbi:hypothetical protein ACIBCM_04170 [Streptomyces sp. NPDC051018]|uniref:hypothetical protein n=1 Tax=Streptomyces sp. NPDC051018 TaxID=3365639 RepID=UPI0037A71BF6